MIEAHGSTNVRPFGRAHGRGRLRIALVAPAWFPVPPRRYGGTELVVSALADGLAGAGHAVTLFASGDSHTHARLCSVYAQAPSTRLGDETVALRHALACYRWAAEFDLIHDHSGPAAVALAVNSATPVLHTVHGTLEGELGDLYEGLAEVAPGAGLVSISHNQRRAGPHLPWVANCPNGLDLSRYPVKSRAGGDYLAFLGRMAPDKGVHRAIELARVLGVPLRIAAKCRSRAEHDYFRLQIAPLLDDRIVYLGEVCHREKLELLRGARALLFPIDWEEPFGLAMIEAMACGTPVIATRRGSVPEVVDEGVTGAIIDDPAEIEEALASTDRLDPETVRGRAQERFSAHRMVADHLQVYRSVLRQADPLRGGRWVLA